MPAAATVQAVTRPFQKAAVRAMKIAVKAKSAPKRRGSPRAAPTSAPTIDMVSQPATNGTIMPNQ